MVNKQIFTLLKDVKKEELEEVMKVEAKALKSLDKELKKISVSFKKLPAHARLLLLVHLFEIVMQASVLPNYSKLSALNDLLSVFTHRYMVDIEKAQIQEKGKEPASYIS